MSARTVFVAIGVYVVSAVFGWCLVAVLIADWFGR